MRPVLLLVAMLAFLGSALVQLTALVDAVGRPEAALAGRGGRRRWVRLLAVGLVLPGVGLALAAVYLLRVRPSSWR